MPFKKGNPGKPKGAVDASPRSKRGLVKAVTAALGDVPPDARTEAQVTAALVPILSDLLDPDRALRELATLAYANVQDLYDERGDLRPIHTLPREVAACIAGTETIIKNAAAGDGHMDKVLKIKHWDKPKALHDLLTHLGLLIEKREVTLGMSEEILSRLDAWKARNKDLGNP